MTDRTQLAVTVSAVLSGCAALARIGWFGSPASLVTVSVIVLVGAVAAGAIRGESNRGRLGYALAFLFSGAVIVVAGELYWPEMTRVNVAEGTRSIDSWNVLVPMAVGMVTLVPGFWAVRRCCENR